MKNGELSAVYINHHVYIFYFFIMQVEFRNENKSAKKCQIIFPD